MCVPAGSKYTLETRPQELGLDVREELLKLHSKYYSSNLMALVVLGRGELSDRLLYYTLSLIGLVTHERCFLFFCCREKPSYSSVSLSPSVPHTETLDYPSLSLTPHTETLDELASLVEALFSPIVTKSVPVPEFPEHPYSENELQVGEYGAHMTVAQAM